ncbi:MAG: matrixin family metalloprotease, partial [Tepidiformaceae bacterium]
RGGLAVESSLSKVSRGPLTKPRPGPDDQVNMNRIVMLPLVAVLVTGAIALGGRQTQGSAAGKLNSLSLAVGRDGGPPLLLEFEVRAADAKQAQDAALRALPDLVPGGRVLSSEDGQVAAQWAQWSWLWDDSELPVPVAYNPNDAPPTVSPSAVTSALSQWSTVPGSRFAYKWAGFTDHIASMATSGPDGENVISWQSLDCSNGCVLGVTSKETVHESDLVLNSNPLALMGDGSEGTADAASVILHETGHMAGLAHSCAAPFAPCTQDETDAVMYYQYRGIRRKLTADDMAGMVTLYPAGGSTTPVPPGPPPPPAQTPPTLEQAVTLTLSTGWNLTLLPAGDVAPTAAGLACADAIYRFDGAAWQSWFRSPTFAPPGLTTVDPGAAYWVHATQPCSHAFSDQ